MTKEVKKLELSKDELIILSSFIARYNNGENPNRDAAEKKVLWNLECILETLDDDIFNPNHKEIFAAAKERVADKD